jgi:hypothetical protein
MSRFVQDAAFVLAFCAAWIALLAIADVGGRAFWRWWRR